MCWIVSGGSHATLRSELRQEGLCPGLFALAIPSCGPTDAPIVLIYLAAQSFELSQPEAPFVQVHFFRASTELKAGDVFEIGEHLTEANAWFHNSEVETMQAYDGEIGVTAFNANTLSGYVDLELENGPAFSGTRDLATETIACG